MRDLTYEGGGERTWFGASKKSREEALRKRRGPLCVGKRDPRGERDVLVEKRSPRNEKKRTREKKVKQEEKRLRRKEKRDTKAESLGLLGRKKKDNIWEDIWYYGSRDQLKRTSEGKSDEIRTRKGGSSKT